MAKPPIRKTPQRRPHPAKTPSARAGEDSFIHPPTLWLALALTVTTFLAYVPALSGGALWDDESLLFGNPLLRSLDGLAQIWFSTKPADFFPLTLTSFWIEWRLWATNPIGYHIVNVVLHIATSLLLWRFLHFMRIPGAFWGALLFALHPVNVASVAWIAERKNTLSGVFYFLSLLGFWEWMEGGRKSRYWLSLLFFLCALLAKTSTVVLPILLLILGWWHHRQIQRRDILASLPFFLLSLLLGLITIWFQQHRAIGEVVVRPEGLAERIATAGMAVWFYLCKITLPLNLTMVYPRWDIDERAILPYLPTLALLALTLILWRYRTRTRSVLFPFLVFVISLGPILGLINMSFHQYSLVADHFAYLAIPAFTALLAATINSNVVKFKTQAAILIPLAVLFFGLSFQRSIVFSSEENVWKDTIKKNPNTWVAYGNLGFLAATKGEPLEARQQFSKALQLAPENVDLLENRGHTFAETQQIKEAMRDYDEAARRGSKKPTLYYYRGVLLSQLNNNGDAIRDFSRALQLNPHYGLCYLARAAALISSGRPQEAYDDLQQAARLGIQPPPELVKAIPAKPRTATK